MPLEEVPPPPDETGNAIVDGLAIRKWEKEHGVKLKAWKLAQASKAAAETDPEGYRRSLDHRLAVAVQGKAEAFLFSNRTWQVETKP